MKKIYSLIKASMTSDMSIFKIKTKKNSKLSSILIPLFLAFYFMFMIWAGANGMFEKLAPMHIQYVLLALFAFVISIMTLIEGIYKTSSLIFNCKDDQLLLSLPIKKRTVLFLRIFKFYIFELIFNSMFLLPVMIAYIRWGENLNWTYYLTSIIMLLFLPIIPIILSCIIGVISSSVTSRFKYKNAVQIITSLVFIIVIMAISFNMDKYIEYLLKHATSINDLITKIYYPAGIYSKLVVDFNIVDLLAFIIINIIIFTISIFILSKFYFKINSRLKKVITSKTNNNKELIIKSNNSYISLIKKELNIFFKTPVFIINAGFALVLFIIIVIIISLKFDSFLPILISKDTGMGLEKNIIINNISIIIFMLIALTSFMTSITNSVISLEGRNINILKSLPIKIKDILMSKIYSGLVLTTPVLLIGDIILFIRFKIKLLEAILLLILSILIPLVSHFIGLIVNLKYPKLDAENSSEVVKQSVSSFLSVTIGMVLLMITMGIILKVIGKIKPLTILLSSIIIFLFIDTILYLYLTKRSIKDFEKLNV